MGQVILFGQKYGKWILAGLVAVGFGVIVANSAHDAGYVEATGDFQKVIDDAKDAINCELVGKFN